MTDLDALDRLRALYSTKRCELTWDERYLADNWPTEIYNAYPAIAAELREARKRVRELEAEIEVRDNSANVVLDTLKTALPNRGFHSEMEAAEAAATELTELRAKLAAAEANGEQYRKNWKSLQDLTGEECLDRARYAVKAWKEAAEQLDAAQETARRLTQANGDLRRERDAATERAETVVRAARKALEAIVGLTPTHRANNPRNRCFCPQGWGFVLGEHSAACVDANAAIAALAKEGISL